MNNNLNNSGRDESRPISNGMKKGYKADIEHLTLENSNFRKVLYTAKNCQLVLMSIAPSDEIGMEVHNEGDQFFRFELGTGHVIIDETTYEVSNGDVIIVPQGSRHNIINTSAISPLKLYTLYTPPHHKDGIIRATKEKAVEDSPEWSGETTE